MLRLNGGVAGSDILCVSEVKLKVFRKVGRVQPGGLLRLASQRVDSQETPRSLNHDSEIAYYDSCLQKEDLSSFSQS